MGRRTFPARITTPKSTAEASPQETSVSLPQGTLVSIEVVIPVGHAGLTGIAVEYAGEHIFPWGTSEWIEGDDEVLAHDVGLEIGGSPVTVRTYNTDDTFDHDHLLRFTVQDLEPGLRERVRPVGLAPADLNIPAADSSDEDLPAVGDPLEGIVPTLDEVVEL